MKMAGAATTYFIERLGCDEEINARGESGGSQRRERGDPENVMEKENGKVQPPPPSVPP